MPLERNPENGIFETENLEIYNKGQAMTQICETDVDVYFELVKSEGLKSDTIYFPVYDYFTYSVIGNVGDEEICHCGGRDNHKKFIELYHSTIEAINSSNNLYYFIYKVFLSKIEYTDIYEEKHIRYYIDKKEVSKEKYDKIVAHSYECNKYDNYNYSLNKLVTISFSDMKQVIDNVDRNKKK